MTEGKDWSEPPFETKSFRVNYWRMTVQFFAILFSFGLVFIAGLLIFEKIRYNSIVDLSTLTLLILTLLKFAFFLAVFESAIMLIYRVDVTSNTISSLNGWSMRKQFTVDSIVKTYRPIQSLGLFLLIRSRDDTVLWIPLSCFENEEFVNTIKQVAKNGNPLLEFSAKREERKLSKKRRAF